MLPDACETLLDAFPPIQRRADRAVYPYGGEGTLAILATDLEFEGSRVKSPILGRDFNPFGRGDGAYYAQGAMAIYNAKPAWIGEITTSWGNSICNGDAVPTALDLGGSPSGGAEAGGAAECCGSGVSGPDDESDECNLGEFFKCAGPHARARNAALRATDRAFNMIVKLINTTRKLLGAWGLLRGFGEGMVTAFASGIYYVGWGGIGLITEDWLRDWEITLGRVRARMRYEDEWATNRGAWIAYLDCLLFNAEVNAYYNYRMARWQAREAYRVERNKCAARWCPSASHSASENPKPLAPQIGVELKVCLRPGAAETHEVNYQYAEDAFTAVLTVIGAITLPLLPKLPVPRIPIPKIPWPWIRIHGMLVDDFTGKEWGMLR